MSDNLDAFEDLLDAQEESLGYRPTATVGVVSTKDCIPTSIRAELVAVAGGSGEQGGYDLQMRASDFDDVQPSKFTLVSISVWPENNLRVLSVNEAGGVYTMTVGDPAANR